MSYTCQFCRKIFQTIIQYNNHQKLHKNEPSYTVTCLYTRCNKIFQLYESFYRHNLRYNRAADRNIFKCPFEGCNAGFKNSNFLKRHYKKHSEVQLDTFDCSLCPDEKTFSTENRFRVHVSRYHRESSNQNETVEPGK